MDQKKFNLIRNGITKLPPGFRFQQTDEELVFEYLKRKILSWPLPASIIPEINLCSYDPWDLPGEMEKEKYFFSSKEAKYANGNRINRATPSGYWKATGLDRQIGSWNRNRNTVVGMKKTLVFYRGKHPYSSRTDWIMHEYRITSIASTIDQVVQNCSKQVEKWVLCRIFLKNKNREDKSNIVQNEPIFFDFMKTDGERDNYESVPAPSSSSSSNSSNITEVSSTGDDNDDEQISRSFFSI